MDRQQVIVAIVGIVALGAVFSGMLAAALGKIRTRAGSTADRQASAILERMRVLETLLHDAALAREMRLTGIEHSLDAIAIEVERLGEAQRFLSREIAAGALPSQPPTPASRTLGGA